MSIVHDESCLINKQFIQCSPWTVSINGCSCVSTSRIPTWATRSPTRSSRFSCRRYGTRITVATPLLIFLAFEPGYGKYRKISIYSGAINITWTTEKLNALVLLIVYSTFISAMSVAIGHSTLICACTNRFIYRQTPPAVVLSSCRSLDSSRLVRKACHRFV